MSLQKLQVTLPKGQQRMESGPVVFNDDWPGLFLRGDNALHYGYVLTMFLDRLKQEGVNLHPLMEESVLRALAEDLNSCDNRLHRKQ